ncbi:putative ribonuclease H-like domain-containing protein [Tanacetum coccineum]
MVAIDGAGFYWSYMADDEVPTNMALMAFLDSEVNNDKTCSKTCLKSFETLKTQLDDLRIEFNKSEFNLATYKRGLASVEEQLFFYKKNEVIFCEQLAVLKRDISYKDSEISMLKSELEKLKQEKESNQLKIENFNITSKSLDKLIGSQITDKSRKGYGPKTSKSVSKDISNEVRESPAVPFVKELVSDDKLEKKTAFPTVAKIEFIKTKKQEKPVRKPVKLTAITIKGIGWQKAVNTARPNSTIVNAVRTNQVNDVKASACWVWRPTKLNSASITLKGHNYIDARGRSKSGTCPISQTLRNLMEDMLPLGEEPKEGKLLMCDKKNSVLFNDTRCFVLSPDFKLADESQVLLKVPRKNNMYSIDMKNIIPKEILTCLVAKATLDESMLCHRRLAHVNFKTINKLVKENLVRGLPSKRFENDQTCVACLKGKQHKACFDKKVKIIICDNETEFKNRVMSEFCEKKGIKKEFSVARTLEENGVAERRNRTLIEAARTMLADFKLPTTFWAKVVNTTCYVQNRVLAVKSHNKNPYELFRGRTHVLSFMRPFGCHVTILNTLDYLGKFYGKSDERFFVGYSLNSKTFRVYNIRTRKVEENMHIRFLEDKLIIAGDGPKWLFDIDVLKKSMNYVPVVAGTNSNDLVDGSLFDSSLKNASNDEPQPSSDAEKKDDEVTTALLEGTHANFFGDETKIDMSKITTTYLVPSTPNTRIHKDYSLDHVIGDVQSGVQTRRMTITTNEQGFINAVYEGKTHSDLHTCLLACFLSQEEPKKVIQALKDLSWIEAMQEELLQFKLQQMDVKSAFLYGKIKEEVYVCQPLGFEDLEFSDKVYKELCTEFEKLMHKKFQMSSMGELTFFLGLQVTQKDDGIFINQHKYVDEILKKFSFLIVKIASTPMETSKPLMKDENVKDADVHLYRSMIGSLMYLTSSRPHIIFTVCASVRFQVTPKVSYLHAVKKIFRYLKGQPKLGLWYPKDLPFDLEAYTDSDYAGVSLDRKSTTRGFQFLRSRLISWQCKKQTVVANSTTKAKYVAAAIKNLVFHLKTKHIEIRHHFIRDSNEKKLIQMIKIHTDQNVADLLIKAFDQIMRKLCLKWNGTTANDEIQVSAVGLTYYCNMKRASKGYTRENIPLFPTVIVQGPIVQGEGSTHPPRSPTQTPIADETASIGVDVRYGGATTTVTGLEAGHGSGNIDKTPTMPQDSPLPRVNTLGSDEGNLKQTKLTYGAAYTKLIKKVKKLENKGRKIAKIDQDPAISLVQHDAEIQGRNEHDMEFDFDLDAAKDVSTAKKDVSTAKLVSTAGAAVTTASVAVSTAKDKVVRLQAELEEEERKRIARVHEAASSFNVEEWEEIQARVEADEELAQRAYQSEKKHMGGYTLQQLRGYSFDEIKNLFKTTMRRVHTFVPIESETERVILELAAGSSKRDTEEELDQESSKRQKISESSKLAEEPRDKDAYELSQEELQQMMIIVPEQGMNKALDRDDLVMLWSLVKERFNSTKPTDDKEREIWVELKRLFEPDIDDELWKLQKHIHDLTWKLYDSCGVHHVSTEKGIYIYMLVEKENETTLYGKGERRHDQLSSIIFDIIRLKLASIRFKKKVHAEKMRLTWKIASIITDGG